MKAIINDIVFDSSRLEISSCNWHSEIKVSIVKDGEVVASITVPRKDLISACQMV